MDDVRRRRLNHDREGVLTLDDEREEEGSVVLPPLCGPRPHFGLHGNAADPHLRHPQREARQKREAGPENLQARLREVTEQRRLHHRKV